MSEGICYTYDNDGFHLGSEQMDVDEEESKIAGKTVYLLPANATTVEPPATGAGQRAQWDGSAWNVVTDFFGVTVWHIETKESGPWPNHGDLPAEYTEQEPPYPWSGWDDGSMSGAEGWVYDHNLSKQAVKLEARERVEAIGEEDGQADLIVWDGLVGKRIEHILDGGADLGNQEKQEWDRIYANLREATDIYKDMRGILAMDPIPDDFAKDSYWPNSPPRNP